MDSAPSDQEVDAVINGTAPDSDAAAQDGEDSRADGQTAEARLNGLMRLVGRRTTEAEQQKARADTAEAALADAQSRLLAYEGGARFMSDSEAKVVAAEVQAEQAEPEPVEEAEDTTFDFYNPDATFHMPDWSDPASYIEPNAVSRASSVQPLAQSDTQRVRSKFEAGLDAALQQWGVEGRS